MSHTPKLLTLIFISVISYIWTEYNTSPILHAYSVLIGAFFFFIGLKRDSKLKKGLLLIGTSLFVPYLYSMILVFYGFGFPKNEWLLIVPAIFILAGVYLVIDAMWNKLIRYFETKNNV